MNCPHQKLLYIPEEEHGNYNLSEETFFKRLADTTIQHS